MANDTIMLNNSTLSASKYSPDNGAHAIDLLIKSNGSKEARVTGAA